MKKETLKKRVKYLEKVCGELESRIKALEAKILTEYKQSDFTQTPSFPTEIIPSLPPQDDCNHEYPNPWGSILPPSCTKCGKQALIMTFTC